MMEDNRLPSDVHTSPKASLASQEGLMGYHPDGLHDTELSALQFLKTGIDPDDASIDGDLGEAATTQLQAFSSHKQHQPLKSLGEIYGGKEVINFTEPCQCFCLNSATVNSILNLPVVDVFDDGGPIGVRLSEDQGHQL